MLAHVQEVRIRSYIKGGIALKTLAMFRRLSLLAVFTLVVLCAATAFCAANPSELEEVQETVSSVLDAVKSSLVRIHVVSVDHTQGREVKQELYGSGVIISSEGHAITNHHVAGHAKQLTCTLADKSEVEAELVGTDPLTDIAVIKLKPEEPREFPAARFGDSSRLKVGDRVFAMGSPFALSQSVTMGIVSNLEMIMPPTWRWADLTLDGEDVGSIVRWIGHDARIHRGNSGGPLVNIDGEIVGINEISIGLGGAVPGNLAREVAEELIANGSVRRSWLGVTLQPLLKSMSDRKGVLVATVVDDSPAQRAGLRAGDVLLSIAGMDCTALFDEEVPLVNQLTMSLPADTEVEAVVRRGEEEMTLTVTLTDREKAKDRPKELKEWGLCASNITSLTAREMQRADTSGVLVSSVRPGGPCGSAKPSIIRNDVIVEVSGKPVNSVSDLRQVTEEITEGQKDPVPTIVAFDRGADKYLTVVKVGFQDLKDPGLEVSKAWLPTSIQVVTRDMAEALGMPGQKGVRITQIYPNSTAEQAGLQVGDILVSIDGSPIPASEPEDHEVLPAMIRQYRIGSEAEFAVIRDGQTQKITVELTASPKLPREMKRYRNDDFDFTVRDIAFKDQIDQKWSEDQQGVLVESVGEGGWASLAGLRSNDLIVEIDGQIVTDVTTVEELMKGIAERQDRVSVFKVKRGIHYRFVELEPSWSSE